MQQLRRLCRELHYGSQSWAKGARYGLLLFDLTIIVYFVITTFLPLNLWIILIDIAIGCLLIIELASRAAADSDPLGMLLRPLTVIDFLIIVSLFLPATVANFAFLRIVRALRLARSYYFAGELRRYSAFFARSEDVIFSAINLVVFIFVVTAVVFVLQEESNPAINNYVDALYFTIATLTTTGFGDIILVGSQGRLLAVVIMIVGVALFIRLVQTIFRPNKVRYECPVCGLTRHEADAVHCKHCGHELHIPTEGFS
jgi:voltage-gated potassium channel